MAKEPLLKVGETTFYLVNFVNISYSRFEKRYCPDGVKINGINWDTRAVWRMLQDALIAEGLREDNKDLKRYHAK